MRRQPPNENTPAETAGAWEVWLDQQAAAISRPHPWATRTAGVEDYLTAVEPLRQRLRERLRLGQPPPPGGTPLGRQPSGSLPQGSIERLFWKPTPGVNADGYYLRRDDAQRPLLILCHGLNSSPEQWLQQMESPGGQLVRRLLEQGFGLLIPRLAPGWPLRLRLARKARLLGWEWLGLEALTVSRLLDQLLVLPTIDATRVGVYGFSRGGQLAMFLATLDDRIGAVGVGSWLTDRQARLLDTGDTRQPSYLTSPEEEQFIPGWLREFDDARLAALIAPEPLLVTSGLDDPVIARELVEATFDAIADLYEALGLGDLAMMVLAAGGHEPLVADTADFFAHHLCPTPPAGAAPSPTLTFPSDDGPGLSLLQINRRRRAARAKRQRRLKR